MTPPAVPWPPGAATGVGSLPGTDPLEAARLVVGELPDLPHLPELPARGPAAALVGRGTAFLAELHVDLQPAGWRLVERPGADERRARGLLAADLDALEEAAGGYAGAVKVQAAGPWTLAAGVELPRGNRVLSDPGAVRDLVASLAEGLSGHLGAVRRRLPRARLLVQLDEPALPAVLAGRLPTASGFDVLPAVEQPVATEALRAVLAAVSAADAVPLVHCCAERPPVRLAVAAGARAVGLDASRLTERDDDALGEAVDAGVGLLLGLVPSTEPPVAPTTAELAARAGGLWRRLGFPAERLATSVLPTPTCGLAGASPAWARAALRRVREVGRALAEDADRAVSGR